MKHFFKKCLSYAIIHVVNTQTLPNILILHLDTRKRTFSFLFVRLFVCLIFCFFLTYWDDDGVDEVKMQRFEGKHCKELHPAIFVVDRY